MIVSQMTSELSNKIANMGFVCACLVVLIHVPSVTIGWWLNDFIQTWVKQGLAMIAVPVFFIISGFLLGRHICEDGWWGKAIASRVRTLVIPFFALNVLWFPFFYGIHLVGVRYFGADGSNANMDFTIVNFLYWVGLLPWGGGGGRWPLVHAHLVLPCFALASAGLCYL